MSINLSDDDLERYKRHIIIDKIGISGQKKLLNSKLLVIGAGGLGSTLILSLVACGIGNIAIIDYDKIDLSNLQRQILYNEDDIGKFKIDVIRNKLYKINKNLNIQFYNIKIDDNNINHIIDDYDYIIDASDNFKTRFTINKLSYQYKKTLIFTAVKEFTCQMAIFKSYIKGNSCYACFNPNYLNNSQLALKDKGILGSVANLSGSMQATYVIKDILSIGDDLTNKMLIFDFLNNRFREINIKKNPDCNICNNISTN